MAGAGEGHHGEVEAGASLLCGESRVSLMQVEAAREFESE